MTFPGDTISPQGHRHTAFPENSTVREQSEEPLPKRRRAVKLGCASRLCLRMLKPEGNEVHRWVSAAPEGEMLPMTGGVNIATCKASGMGPEDSGAGD